MSNAERSSGRRFDRDHGVTTQAILFLSDLDPDAVGDASAHATHYEAVPVADFRRMLDAIPSDAAPSSVFVDIGAGMGRAVLLASRRAFKQVVGVEVSPGLYEIARENIARVRNLTQRCRDVRIVRADARLWKYPAGNLVVFMYNPFDEIAVVQALGAIVHTRHPGDVVYLLYHTPVHDEPLRALGFTVTERFSFGAMFLANF